MDATPPAHHPFPSSSLWLLHASNMPLDHKHHHLLPRVSIVPLFPKRRHLRSITQVRWWPPRSTLRPPTPPRRMGTHQQPLTGFHLAFPTHQEKLHHVDDMDVLKDIGIEAEKSSTSVAEGRHLHLRNLGAESDPRAQVWCML
ncbi:hypothetical protein HU200_016874 [Digitaria exilis]|uniref:Uncharacterized protein n=1 Tax=Digitaria exilis TaxID=1010633 RepID=A0A835F848_9POAL|nr:hypothetical protein HU200_016874 [Digitaria exilis]